MSSGDRDEVRDYGFGDKALALRHRSGLTQRGLALLLDVHVKSIGGWEAGLFYPSAERLQQLIALYLERGALEAGLEVQEAAALWETARQSAPRRLPPFDERWFASLHGAGSAAVPATPTPEPATGGASRQDRHTVPASTMPRHDWGEAPFILTLQGRVEEQALLEGWVREGQCRVVQVLGPGGIGKTTLAARLAHEVAPSFAVLHWRSLRNAPPPEEWLAGVISALSAAQTVPPEGLQTRLSLVLTLLREQRTLLVLDNLETILEPGATAGRYRVGYEGYGEALRLLAEREHQGCLLLTSREQPLRADEPAVRALYLAGLGATDGRALLASRELAGDEAAWGRLVERYGGNPLALKVVGETIESVFEGDVASFLAEEATVFGDIRSLLDEQVTRLSELERAVGLWLAVEREPVGFAVLAADLGPGVGRAQLLEAVEGLRRRSLLEAGGHGSFTLQPVVLEYATGQLVERVQREVVAGEPLRLVSHALVKATAKDYVRRSQERLIAGPLLEQLRTQSGLGEVERLLLALLERWRGRGHEEQGYGPGNVVNLLRLLRGEVRGLDLSHLSIRQAYLAEAEAQDTSLAGAHLEAAALAEAFTFPTSVALSADGVLLAAGTSTGGVRLWRVADRMPLLALPGHSGTVGAMALSGDGTLLASGGTDGMVKLWEAASGRSLATLQGHDGGVNRVALSADGRLVASGGVDGTVRLWEAPTGRLLAVLEGHTGEVRGVTFSGDGTLVASGGFDGTVRLWEAASGRSLAMLQGHASGVLSVALSGDGTLLASGGLDQTVKLWEAPSGKLLAALQGHAAAVWHLALSADGRLVASGGQDGTIGLWEAQSGRPLAMLQGHLGMVNGVALSTNGGLVASGGQDGTVKVWEAPSGRSLATLQGFSGGVNGVALSADGGLLASGSYDGTVTLWQAPSGRALATLQGHGSGWGVAVSADGGLVAAGTFDGTVRLWEAASGRPPATLQGHRGTVWCVAMSAGGGLVAAGVDGTVWLWEAPSGRSLATLQEHSGPILGVALSADGRLVASGGFDGTVKLWEAAGERSLATLEAYRGPVRCVALSGDGRLVASGGVAGTVKVWEAPSGRPLATLEGHGGGVYEVALSGDGRLVASGCGDGTVKVWALPSGQLLATMRGHSGPVRGVTLSADGRLVASGGQDGTVRLWEASSGTCLHVLRAERRYERMDITGVTGVTEAQWAALLALGAEASTT